MRGGDVKAGKTRLGQLAAELRLRGGDFRMKGTRFGKLAGSG
jgi:hypothetical protein